jgi:phosphohistidine phosphatase SixA
MLAKRVYEGDGGYAVVQLITRQDPNTAEFDKDADRLVAELRQARAQAFVEEWMKTKCEQLVKDGRITPNAGLVRETVEQVGAKLRALGDTRQVLCVTHQPQVAAAGHAQYRVSKAAQDGITQSSVHVLDADGRIGEIARMLGGAEVSKEARAAAKKLLADSL